MENNILNTINGLGVLVLLYLADRLKNFVFNVRWPAKMQQPLSVDLGFPCNFSDKRLSEKLKQM
ncbi:hypothetical protein [Methylosoma difficile]